ncbi:unnamed protein product [Rhizophagus irregularis]|nr:unnamed protein product [Rhizophagus irregularis]CAB5388326.1 unnamed protein product [Rhizophagus irregularis]
MRLPTFLSQWGVYLNRSLRYYKQQSYQSYPNSQSHPNHQSYPCPLVQSFKHKNIERNFRSYTAAEFAR